MFPCSKQDHLVLQNLSILDRLWLIVLWKPYPTERWSRLVMAAFLLAHNTHDFLFPCEILPHHGIFLCEALKSEYLLCFELLAHQLFWNKFSHKHLIIWYNIILLYCHKSKHEINDIFLPSSSIKTAIHFSVNRILLGSKHGIVIHNAAKKGNILEY